MNVSIVLQCAHSANYYHRFNCGPLDGHGSSLFNSIPLPNTLIKLSLFLFGNGQAFDNHLWPKMKHAILEDTPWIGDKILVYT